MRVRPRSARLLRWAILCSILIGLCLPVWAADQSSSIVAIGDVHGDFDSFTALLRRLALIDKQNHWAGGKTVFVQVGDLIDRGPKPREALDLMMSLQKEAAQAGGTVIPLIGNHEAMNVMGDLRYVTVGNYAAYAAPHSEERRHDAFRQYVSWRKSHPQLLAEVAQPVFEDNEGDWMTHHPAGFLEQREAFSQRGTYGKWIRERPAVGKVAGTVFVHGGISPELSSSGVDELNRRVHRDFQAFDSTMQYLGNERIILPFFNFDQVVLAAQAELQAENKGHVAADQERQAKLVEFLKNTQSWLIGERPDGPFWFRGYDHWTDEEGQANVPKILDGLKADTIVVGHTVQKGGQIRPRFDHRIFLIDTGMLSSFYGGGQASALAIKDGKISADYMNQQIELVSNANPLEKDKQQAPTAVPQGEGKD